MEDSYHWLSLGFLAHLAAVTLSPPNGAMALYAASKDVPSGWYPRLVLAQQLAQAAQGSDTAAFSQLLTLRASDDWRFVYGYTLAMQEIVAHCSDAGIRSQAQGQLQTLQRFNQFRLQKFNGCCFFKRCCQNRNQWIQRQARIEVVAHEHAEVHSSPAALYSETGNLGPAGHSSFSPPPPPRPASSHLPPGDVVQMSSYTPG